MLEIPRRKLLGMTMAVFGFFTTQSSLLYPLMKRGTKQNTEDLCAFKIFQRETNPIFNKHAILKPVSVASSPSRSAIADYRNQF
jgi:hypothetical protein